MTRKPKISTREVEEAIKLLEAQGLVEHGDDGIYHMKPRDIPAVNCIQLYFHCRQCIETLPRGQSPAEWRRISCGFTEIGMQVWCDRHECNIAHIDFEGQAHPVNKGKTETRQ